LLDGGSRDFVRQPSRGAGRWRFVNPDGLGYTEHFADRAGSVAVAECRGEPRRDCELPRQGQQRQRRLLLLMPGRLEVRQLRAIALH
jgi:hypothetical protein